MCLLPVKSEGSRVTLGLRVRTVQAAKRQELYYRPFWRSQSLLLCFVETDLTSYFMLALHLTPFHLNLPNAGVTLCQLTNSIYPLPLEKLTLNTGFY